MNILEYQNYQEIKSHGDPTFPYITYPCSIPLDFPSVPVHWHDEVEIIYVKKGSGIISIDLTRHCVYSGMIALILPGQLHSIEQKETEYMEYENIIFHPDMLFSKQKDSCSEDFLLPLFNRQIVIPSLLKPGSELYASVANCLDETDEICKHYPQAYQFAIKGKLFELFYHLFSNYHYPNHVRIPPSKSLDRLKNILSYVETHYSEKLTIAQIAKISGFSESHFMKFFKQNMGISFIHYRNDYRLNMAAKLLLSSSSDILDISEECGFDNLSHFNRLFRKKYGQTPSHYRKLTYDLL